MKLIKRRNHQTTLPTFFDDFFTKDFFNLDHEVGNFKTRPLVNVIETDEAFRIEVAAPGLRKDAFNVEIDQNVLSIEVKEVADEEVKEKKTTEKFNRREFNYVSFKRSFTIPQNTVDTEKIKADYKNGILKLQLPKLETAKVKAKRVIDIK